MKVADIQTVLSKKLYEVNGELIFLEKDHPDAGTIPLINPDHTIKTITVDSADITSENIMTSHQQTLLDNMLSIPDNISDNRVVPSVGEYCINIANLGNLSFKTLLRVKDIDGSNAKVVGYNYAETIKIDNLCKVTVTLSDLTDNHNITIDTI